MIEATERLECTLDFNPGELEEGRTYTLQLHHNGKDYSFFGVIPEIYPDGSGRLSVCGDVRKEGA